MKITIAEGGPAWNVGSMALIENAIKLVRQKHKGCDVTIMCFDPVSVAETLKKDGLAENIKVMGELFYKPKKDKLSQSLWLLTTISWFIYSRFLLLFTKRISKFMSGEKKLLLKEIEQSEFVYCIGAERINDIYFKSALLALYCIETYIKMGAKVVHLSLTIGPVFNSSTIHVAKKVLNKSYAIIVRDQKSYDILKKWNCTAPYQFRSYDIAIMQDIDDKLGDDLMYEFCIKREFIAVSVIEWAFRKANGPSRMPEYNKAHASVLDYIVEKYDKDIVFVHTVFGGMFGKGDAKEAAIIISMMKHRDRVISIERLLTPKELASLLSKCSFGIVTRMHAAILCSGAGRRPIIAVNYLYKLREYMKNIGFENYSIDIDYVSENGLKFLVDKMFANINTNNKLLDNKMLELITVLTDNLSYTA